MPDTETVHILVIDDNGLVGPSLARWFGRLSDLRYAGSVSSTKNAARAVRDSGATLVLLDFHIPGEDTVEAIRELTRACPGVPVAMFSAYLEPDDVRRCMVAGARAYLSKAESPVGLAAKIKMIAQGSRVFSSDVESALMLDGGYRPA